MADISDVLTVIAKAASAAVYPNGSTQPSITNSDVIIYPGWPSSNSLDQDLNAGKTHVTVYPKPEERNTTRYPEKCVVTALPVNTVALTTGSSGGNATVTVGGTVSTPQNLMLRINGKQYVYSVNPSDTAQSIAIALAALLVADFPGTAASGSKITITGVARIQAARTGGFGTVAREIRRQERLVMITVWAPAPGLRDKIASAIDVSLAAQRFLTMPDDYGARIIYKNSLLVDSLQKAVLYRRDVNYLVEYATTQVEKAAAVIAPHLTLRDGWVAPEHLDLEDGGKFLLEDGGDLLLEDGSSETTITI